MIILRASNRKAKPEGRQLYGLSWITNVPTRPDFSPGIAWSSGTNASNVILPYCDERNANKTSF